MVGWSEEPVAHFGQRRDERDRYPWRRVTGRNDQRDRRKQYRVVEDDGVHSGGRIGIALPAAIAQQHPYVHDAAAAVQRR